MMIVFVFIITMINLGLLYLISIILLVMHHAHFWRNKTMSDYATIGHVRALNNHRTYLATTGKPTLTQITSYFIPSVTGEMNSRFSAVGITTPITTSATHDAYLYVNKLASMKVACIAENSTYMGGNKNESPHAKKYCDAYETAMKAIEKDPSILIAIINGTSGASLDSYEYSNVDERRDTEPFERGEDKW
jgi:hypothetical protein